MKPSWPAAVRVTARLGFLRVIASEAARNGTASFSGTWKNCYPEVIPPGRPHTDRLTAVPQQLGKSWFGNGKGSFETGSPRQPDVSKAVPGAVPTVEPCPGGLLRCRLRSSSRGRGCCCPWKKRCENGSEQNKCKERVSGLTGLLGWVGSTEKKI